MKQRLVENVLLSPDFYRKLYQGQEALKESVLVEGVNYKALAVYRFKFTRPGKENLNGRVYGYELWDRVIQLRKGGSTLALMNHPPEDDPGDPRNIWAVARNIEYDSTKEFVEADFYIIDNEWGKTALGVLEAGGNIGLSSSGFGEFLADGKTVDPATFELERVADWVMEPSYEVFGHLDDKVTETASHKKEQSQDKERKMDLSERKLKKIMEINLHKICETISEIKDPVERRTKSLELLELYDESDLGASKSVLEEMVKDSDAAIQTRMEKGEQFEELNEKLEETNSSLSESQKEIERLKEENARLTAKLDEALDTLDSATKFSKDTEQILTETSAFRQNSVPYQSYAELREYTRKVVAAYAEQKKMLEKAKSYNKAFAKKLQGIIQERQERKTKVTTSRKLVERQEKRAQERKALQERRAKFEEEQEKIRRANPEVVRYFRDVVQIHPELMEQKEAILKKRTEFEAQMAVLALTTSRESAQSLNEGVFDLSTPISERHTRKAQIPEPELRIQKGYL